MDLVRAALRDIQAEGTRAPEIIEAALEEDRVRTIAGIAAFIVAALAGIVIDPDRF